MLDGATQRPPAPPSVSCNMRMSMDVSQQHLNFFNINGALEPMGCGLWFFSGHLFEIS
jgi:hypothetical protein